MTLPPQSADWSRATPVKWFRVRKGIRRIISSTAPEKSFFNGGTVRAQVFEKGNGKGDVKSNPYEVPAVALATLCSIIST